MSALGIYYSDAYICTRTCIFKSYFSIFTSEWYYLYQQ